MLKIIEYSSYYLYLSVSYSRKTRSLQLPTLVYPKTKKGICYADPFTEK